jgi:hypothetical protein
MTAILTGIGIGFGIVIGCAVVAFLMFFTQDMGIWRAAPKEYDNP